MTELPSCTFRSKWFLCENIETFFCEMDAESARRDDLQYYVCCAWQIRKNSSLLHHVSLVCVSDRLHFTKTSATFVFTETKTNMAPDCLSDDHLSTRAPSGPCQRRVTPTANHRLVVRHNRISVCSGACLYGNFRHDVRLLISPILNSSDRRLGKYYECRDTACILMLMGLVNYWK